MAKTNAVKVLATVSGGKLVKEEAPVTTVKGKVVQVTGTKGGAISLAQTQAKAARLQGAGAPGNVGKYSGSQKITVASGAANPHRAGTYRHKAFTAMQGCKTAGDYALTGYKPKYLAAWAALGLIRLS